MHAHAYAACVYVCMLHKHIDVYIYIYFIYMCVYTQIIKMQACIAKFACVSVFLQIKRE